MKGVVFLPSAFSVSVEMISLLMLCIAFMNLLCWTLPTYHGKSHLIRVSDLSDVLLDSVSQYFTEFCIWAHQGFWAVVVFLSCIFFWSGDLGDAAFIGGVWEDSLPFSCLNIWKVLDLALEKSGRLQQWSHLVLSFLCWEGLDYQFTVHLSYGFVWAFCVIVTQFW